MAWVRFFEHLTHSLIRVGIGQLALDYAAGEWVQCPAFAPFRTIATGFSDQTFYGLRVGLRLLSGMWTVIEPVQSARFKAFADPLGQRNPDTESCDDFIIHTSISG